jgi:hypothetical protein
MVNVYNFEETNIAELSRNQSLIDSCMSTNPKLTPGDIRRNLDLAVGIMRGYSNKVSKVVKKEEPVEDYSQPPCSNCGSDKMMRTGTCYTCICGTTSGCS